MSMLVAYDVSLWDDQSLPSQYKCKMHIQVAAQLLPQTNAPFLPFFGDWYSTMIGLLFDMTVNEKMRRQFHPT